MLVKGLAVLNDSLSSLGMCGSAISAQPGPTEERGGRERVQRAQHQDQQTDGKGCTGTSAFNPFNFITLITLVQKLLNQPMIS